MYFCMQIQRVLPYGGANQDYCLDSGCNCISCTTSNWCITGMTGRMRLLHGECSLVLPVSQIVSPRLAHILTGGWLWQKKIRWSICIITKILYQKVWQNQTLRSLLIVKAGMNCSAGQEKFSGPQTAGANSSLGPLEGSQIPFKFPGQQ